MEQLLTIADVVAASDGDPRCLWAAQGLAGRGMAWEHGGAVAVGALGLYGRDRIVVRGPAAQVSLLVREAIDSLGRNFVVAGDPEVMAGVLERLPWLEPAGCYGWMDGTSVPAHRPGERVRWLARREWVAAEEVLRAAFPCASERPWLTSVRRWAGSIDRMGRVTCTAAEAWSSPHVGFVAGLAVLPEARRHGQGHDVGGFVLAALLAAQGRAALIVRSGNAPAIRLYAELGMTYRQQQVVRVRAAATALA